MMNRRNFLRTAPLAFTPALAMPCHALAAQAEPIIALYEDWKLKRAAWIAALECSLSGNGDEPECIAAESAVHHAISLIKDCTPKSAEGLAAMLHVFWEEWCPYSGERLSNLDDEPGGWHFFVRIWMAASGREGQPPEVLPSSPAVAA